MPTIKDYIMKIAHDYERKIIPFNVMVVKHSAALKNCIYNKTVYNTNRDLVERLHAYYGGIKNHVN